jgi:hypothetical protein
MIDEQNFALFGGTNLKDRQECGVRATSIIGCFLRQSDALLQIQSGFTWWCIVDMRSQMIIQEWQAE